MAQTHIQGDKKWHKHTQRHNQEAERGKKSPSTGSFLKFTATIKAESYQN